MAFVFFFAGHVLAENISEVNNSTTSANKSVAPTNQSTTRGATTNRSTTIGATTNVSSNSTTSGGVRTTSTTTTAGAQNGENKSEANTATSFCTTFAPWGSSVLIVLGISQCVSAF